MTWQVTIDNGGTFTDGCLIGDGRVWSAKVLTTPYDLMKCFMAVFRSLADASGIGDEQELLRRVTEIRYSTTAGTNALLVRKGVRVGLIVGAAAAANTYGLRARAPELIDSLVGDRVVGMEMGNGAGETLDRDISKALRELLSLGAQTVVVSFPEPWGREGEQEFKRRYMRLFPGHLLGSVPVVFSREMCEDPDDERRTATSILNAFLHRSTAQFLYHADRWAQEHHVLEPLRIMRNDGGCGRVAKTTAVKTLDSGPAGGLAGAGALARETGRKKVITLDVGGTSSDIGVIDDGAPLREMFGSIHALPIAFSFPKLATLALGGGSIFRVENKKMKIGPDSAGALPGPVCFGRGGQEPTLTDAAIVAGYVDPARFAGGTVSVDAKLAADAIAKKIAAPLGLADASAGASAMIDAFAERLVAEVGAVLREQGWKPAEVSLIAFGGSGPMPACRVAEKLGLREVLVPRAAASFSALGVAFCETAHEVRAIAHAGTGEETFAELERRARRDMFGEGIPTEQTVASVRVADGNGTQAVEAGTGWSRKVADAKDGTVVDYRLVRQGSALSGFPQSDERGAQARGGERPVLVDGKSQTLPVVDRTGMTTGSRGDGPCVIEADFWSTVLPRGWKWECADWGVRFAP